MVIGHWRIRSDLIRSGPVVFGFVAGVLRSILWIGFPLSHFGSNVDDEKSRVQSSGLPSPWRRKLWSQKLEREGCGGGRVGGGMTTIILAG